MLRFLSHYESPCSSKHYHHESGSGPTTNPRQCREQGAYGDAPP